MSGYTKEQVSRIVGRATGGSDGLREENAALKADVAELVGALRKISRTPAKPFPDPGAHSWEAFAKAVFTAWRDIQNETRAILAKHGGK